MDITFFYKNLSKEEEKSFNEYVNQKVPSIETFLSKFSKDSPILNASIEKFDKHDAYSVEFSLTFRNKSFIAKEASHHITKAVDDTKDRFIAQIKKHMEVLRDSRSHQSIRKDEAVVSEEIKV